MNKTLEELRKEIDSLDHELVEVLAKRMTAVKKVGELKDMQGLPIMDEKRRQELLEKVGSKAEALAISKSFIEKLFSIIHDHAVEVQKKRG
jgi:chorismate mutase